MSGDSADIGKKVSHVLAAREGGNGNGTHTCHWPGCGKIVPPALWGCRYHWYSLPTHIRGAIWRAYIIGQEDTKRVDGAYMKAARAAQAWIAARSGKP